MKTRTEKTLDYILIANSVTAALVLAVLLYCCLVEYRIQKMAEHARQTIQDARSVMDR